MDLATNIAGFKSVISGEYDHLPENAFYMQGGIADVAENAKAMAARLDTTVKKTGTQKRDVDYIAEYLGFVKQYDEARKKAEAAGSAFDSAAVMASVRKTLDLEKADAELDTAQAARKGGKKA